MPADSLELGNGFDETVIWLPSQRWPGVVAYLPEVVIFPSIIGRLPSGNISPFRAVRRMSQPLPGQVEVCFIQVWTSCQGKKVGWAYPVVTNAVIADLPGVREPIELIWQENPDPPPALIARVEIEDLSIEAVIYPGLNKKIRKFSPFPKRTRVREDEFKPGENSFCWIGYYRLNQGVFQGFAFLADIAEL